MRFKCWILLYTDVGMATKALKQQGVSHVSQSEQTSVEVQDDSKKRKGYTKAEETQPNFCKNSRNECHKPKENESVRSIHRNCTDKTLTTNKKNQGKKSVIQHKPH